MPVPPIETLSVAELMAGWPGVIRVLLDRRMFCVGCPVAPLHTLEDAALAHGVDPEPLAIDVRAAASGTPAGLRAKAKVSAAVPRPPLRR